MNNRRLGYSLFEVLIAFAIMSMVLATILPRQTDMLGRASAIDERALAFDYAMSRLAEIEILGPLTPGSLTDTYRDWRVTETIEPELLVSPDVMGLRLTITVHDTQNRILATLTTRMKSDERP